MKVVLDTSVLIAAFYHPLHRPCFSRDVYDYLAENESIHLSPYILREFHEKCTRKLKMAPPEVRHLESLIKVKAHLEEKVEFAVAISADLLLSWDKDLRNLKKVETTLILSPSEFWNRLNEL